MGARGDDVQPAELAALLDVAERPRVGGWTLRSALTRYAQPRPAQVGELLDLVRRIDGVRSGLVDVARHDGPALWAAATEGDGDGGAGVSPFAIGLVRALIEVDRLGDQLAAWADRWSTDRPDAEVAAATAELRARLDGLGVPEQERPTPPPGRRGRR
jgi:hypothetical protein